MDLEDVPATVSLVLILKAFAKVCFFLDRTDWTQEQIRAGLVQLVSECKLALMLFWLAMVIHTVRPLARACLGLWLARRASKPQAHEANTMPGSKNDIQEQLNNARKELANDFEVCLSKALKDMSDLRAQTSKEMSELRQECNNNMREQLKNACMEFDLKGDSAAKKFEVLLSKALKDLSDFRAQTSKEMSDLRQECSSDIQEHLKNACKEFTLKGDSATKKFEVSLSMALQDMSDFRAQTAKEMCELRQECNTNMQQLFSTARKELDMLTGDSATKKLDVSLSNALNEIADFREQTSKFPEELATLFATGVAAVDDDHLTESTEAVAVEHQHGELRLPVDGMPTNFETLQAPSQIEALAVKLAQEPRQTLNKRPEQAGAKTAGQSETQEGLAPIMAASARMSADANTCLHARLYDLEKTIVAQLSDLHQQFHRVIEQSTEGFKELAGKCDRQTERMDKLVPIVRRNADEINHWQQTVGRSVHTTDQVNFHAAQRMDAAEG